MQLKKYVVTLAVPVNVLVDAKDANQAINRAEALIKQQGNVKVESIKNFSSFPLQSVIVDDMIRAPSHTPEEDSEPMIA